MHNIPTSANINNSYNKEQNRFSKNIIIFLITITLITIIIFFIIFVKVYRIQGTSMNPTLKQGEYVLCLKTNKIERGNIIAFTGRDSFVIKRVIGLPGDKIDISEDGTVSVNGSPLSEEYITNKAKGDVEIPLPYTVPKNSYFVLGDNRGDSLDSRYNNVGAINIDRIICEVKGVS